jgi:hypothetical protein
LSAEKGFAVDASLIAADANKQRSIPGAEWTQELHRRAEARGHALKVAKELSRGSLGGLFISVTDEQAVVVFETQIPV